MLRAQVPCNRTWYVALAALALVTGGAIGCAEVAGTLNGLRLELPCTGPIDAAVGCKCPNTSTASATLQGKSGTQYEVTLRFRGVVEQKAYTGGTVDGYWYAGGGGVANDGFNAYKLTIQDPPQTYFLNAGSSDILHCFAIDYTRTVRVSAGAAVTLTADAGDSVEVTNLDANGVAIVIPGVPPAPQAYNGQFVQMDVVSVHAVR